MSLEKELPNRVAMSQKLRIGLLFGGRSSEHIISLMSARSVLQAFDKDKYDIVPVGITKDGKWIGGDDPLRGLKNGENGDEAPEMLLLGAPHHQRALMQVSAGSSDKNLSLVDICQLDVVFPILHGPFGEDGAIQGLLELADIAYVGAGVVGSAVGMDKAIFKAVMRSADLPVLPYVLVNRSAFEQNASRVIAQVRSELTFPVFVKPCNLGSSVGISRVSDDDHLHTSLVEAARWDRRIVVEQGIDAREIEVSVLGNDDPEASIAGEVVPGREFYDYVSKYVSDDSELLIPAPISKTQMDRVRELSIAAFKAADCSGMARVDFLLDTVHGKLWLNELNTIPGFTGISMYPKLWEASGLSYSHLVDRLILLALERKDDRDKTEREYHLQ